MEAGGGRQQAGGASILNFRSGANAERPYVDRGPPALFWATSQTHTHRVMMVIVMIRNDDHHDHGEDDDGHGDDWAVGTDYATSHPPIILQTHGWVIRSMG